MSYTYEPAPSQRWESLIRTAVEGEIDAHERDQAVVDEIANLDDFITKAATEAERHATRLLFAQSRFGAFHAETEASLKKKSPAGAAVHAGTQHGATTHGAGDHGPAPAGSAEHGARLDVRF